MYQNGTIKSIIEENVIKSHLETPELTLDERYELIKLNTEDWAGCPLVETELDYLCELLIRMENI